MQSIGVLERRTKAAYGHLLPQGEKGRKGRRRFILYPRRACYVHRAHSHRPHCRNRIPRMTAAKYDVLGIGNAIFDVLVQTDESFLERHGMAKGGMALIDEARAAEIYRDMGPATEMSGGSAANTIVGLANLGARAAYIGKVRDDQIGHLYSHDIRAAGVAFETKAAPGGPATGCSYILVTPDGERTMNTYLGAAQELMPDDIDAAQVAASSIVYLEGYLWDPKSAKAAFVKAADIAHGAGRKVALTLSDSFCVDRYRDEFLGLMRKATVDLVFANEAELHSLYQTSDFESALKQLRLDTSLGVVTRSEKGCVVASNDGVVAVPAFPIEKMVDTTGAGDLFAAGFLFGLVRGAGHENAGRLGALAAAEVIQHIGARPQVSLKELAQANGLPV
jgi:sugar/nucleoside kinase (ribokinase family)